MKTFFAKDIVDRLKKGLNLSSDNALSEALGISKTTISNWKSRNSIDFPLIFSKCEHLSADWLLTGRGSMFRDQKETCLNVAPPTTIIKGVPNCDGKVTTKLRNDQITKQKKEQEVTFRSNNPSSIMAIGSLKTLEKKYDQQEINLYDFEATAGLQSLFDNAHANIIDTIKIPNLPKCDGAIHIVGDSMYPLLKSGDIILYKILPLDIQNIFYGEMYLISYQIDDECYVVVKYIKKSDKGEPFVTLASQNPHHADKDINLKRINALALVKASIRINSMM